MLDQLNDSLKSFIKDQHVFFVATAAEDGRINVSPKRGDYFRIIDDTKVVWLNLTGSGNESAAHILKHNRMTIMFCAFDGNPLILRLYGTATAHHERDAAYQEYISLFGPHEGARQIFEMQLDSVQTSCGFAVPLMSYDKDRDILDKWSADKGRDGIHAYWKEKNLKSIDGFKTRIFEDQST